MKEWYDSQKCYGQLELIAQGWMSLYFNKNQDRPNREESCTLAVNCGGPVQLMTSVTTFTWYRTFTWRSAWARVANELLTSKRERKSRRQVKACSVSVSKVRSNPGANRVTSLGCYCYTSHSVVKTLVHWNLCNFTPVRFTNSISPKATDVLKKLGLWSFI